MSCYFNMIILNFLIYCISVVLQMEEAREEYFEQQSSKCVTSDHTLSKLNMPRMDQQVSLRP